MTLSDNAERKTKAGYSRPKALKSLTSHPDASSFGSEGK